MARVEQWEHITFAPVGPVFEYAVKCICGRTDGGAVAPGVHYTAINIHNPTNTTITFRKKFAVAWPSEQARPRTGFISTELRPDHALETDCPDIVRHLRDAHIDGDFDRGAATSHRVRPARLTHPVPGRRPRRLTGGDRRPGPPSRIGDKR